MQEIGPEVFSTKPTSVEIKPTKPGLLAENLKPNERTQEQNKLDYLLVFGQGPVLDESTKLKPEAGKIGVQETAIAWMKNSARAAGELYLEGATKKIILTGGKTGGDYKGITKQSQQDERMSEAELMKEILVNEYHVPESDIILEDKATNTLQNIPLSLNKIDSEQLSDSKKPKIGLLGADFHIPRIRLLADIFGISDHKSFSAEQIFRTIAYKLEKSGNDSGDMQKINEARVIHQQLESLLSMNDDLSFPGSRLTTTENIDQFQVNALKSQISHSTMLSPTLFETQTGKEKEGFREKRLLESYFTRGMMEVPEFWFGYIKFLNNDRLTALISQTNDEILNRFGLKKDTPIEEIRKILDPYTEGDPKNGGKRKMLEGHYGLLQKDGHLTIAKTVVGEGLDPGSDSAHEKLKLIADRLNMMGNQ